MDPTAHRTTIAREGAALASVPSAGLGAPVPSCPGWDVARLIGHVGRVHRWAASFVAGDAEPSAGPRPPVGPEIIAWYRESVDDLLAEFDRHDPTEAVSTFAGPGDVGFWLRRQAHEVTVHRWDAENAVAPGRAGPVPAQVAADGIDEWLEVFVPRFLEKGGGVPSELEGASLHIHCTDDALEAGSGEWLVRFGPECVEVERAHAKGDAALRGAASDLLLAVWHRIPLADVDVVGDSARAEQMLDAVRVT